MRERVSRFFGLAERESLPEVKQISIQEIVPNPSQPRTIFDDERLDELCQTIELHGLIQPIVVRPSDGKYEIIAGERRWRAAVKLQMAKIPAIIRELDNKQAASIALIENLQREGLTSLEEAIAYENLIALHHLTQESLAQRLGKSQSTIANKVRLLQLEPETKQALLERKISERHGRALLSVNNKEMQIKILQEIIEKEMNVKQTEARIALLYGEVKKKKRRLLSFSKDVRLAVNTIRKSIGIVHDSGLAIETKEEDSEHHYEIRILIPKHK